MATATPGVLSGLGGNSPNRLLYVRHAVVTPPVVAADFTGDGRADLALTGAPGWTTIPLAASRGDGTFTVTNTLANDLAFWAQLPGVRSVSGDFTGDRKADIAQVGVPGSDTIQVAVSQGDGTFRRAVGFGGSFAEATRRPGARIVTGDFNADYKGDLALLPGPGDNAWATQPIALGSGDGTFRTTDAPAGEWARHAQLPGTRVLTGDFNGDNRTDLALVPGTGQRNWITQSLALSRGDGSFDFTENRNLLWALWSPGTGRQGRCRGFQPRRAYRPGAAARAFHGLDISAGRPVDGRRHLRHRQGSRPGLGAVGANARRPGGHRRAVTEGWRGEIDGIDLTLTFLRS